MPQRHCARSTPAARSGYHATMETNAYLLMAAALAYSGYMLVAMR